MHHQHPARKLIKQFASVIGIGLITFPAAAQTDLSECIAIEDILERVACYDAAAGRSSSAPSRPVSPPIAKPMPNASSDLPSQATPSSAGSKESIEQFGLEQAEIRKSEDGQEELIDTVVEIKESEPQKYLITLSSGQVWKQTMSQRFQLRKGNDVRIYPTRWGSNYRLSVVGRSGYIQVKRLR